MKTKNPFNFGFLLVVVMLPLIASCDPLVDPLIRATMLPKSENELDKGRKYIDAGECGKGIEYLNKAFVDGGSDTDERHHWDAAAAVSLGYMYQNGKCVVQNTESARSWFEKAVAINGNRNGAQDALARLNGSSSPHTDNSTNQRTSEDSQDTHCVATQYRGCVSDFRLNYHLSTIISCSGNKGAEVLVKGHGTARITKFINGSTTIALPYTVEPVAPGPGVYGYKGRLGVKISGLQSGTLTNDMLDGNEFVFLISEGSWDGELEINFPASFSLQLRYAGESGRAEFLEVPKFYLVNGTCSA